MAGGDLMRELGLSAGAELGRVLRGLFEQVLDGTLGNERGALLAAARALAAP